MRVYDDFCTWARCKHGNKFCSAYFVADGFDVYASVADAGTGSGANGWTSTGVGVFSTRTRWGVGRAWYFSNSNGNGFVKDSGPNVATWIVHTAFCQTDTLGANFNGSFISFREGGVVQCAITFDPTGAIFLRSGSTSGTVIATYSSAFLQNSYDSYQFKVVISNTVGEFHVRKNGATVDSFTATGLNTRGGTANNYANGVALGHDGGTKVQVFDDFFCCYDDGVFPNDWVGDIRAVQLQPNFDTAQKQFAQTSTGSLNFGNFDNTTPSTHAIVANTAQMCIAKLATQGGTFTSVVAELSAGYTGHLKLALYLADGDAQGFLSDNKPGTLVAVSNTVTNPVTGTNTVTFPSTVPVLKGFTYFWGVLSDVGFNFKTDGLQSLPNGYDYATSFAGGFPASLTGLTTNIGGIRPYTIHTVLTATNAGCVNDETEDGAVTYLFDAVVNDFDLFNLNALTYVPTGVIGVNLKAMSQKSDAGGRGMKISAKSGATSFDTNQFLPLTTFGFMSQFYVNDPNTGAVWSSAAVNALQIGGKVSS